MQPETTSAIKTGSHLHEHSVGCAALPYRVKALRRAVADVFDRPVSGADGAGPVKF
jgi:hypothetical protein